MTGADNQQERLGMGWWISGFTDGEGCFAISVIRNPTARFGTQIFPEFVLTQGAKSLSALRVVERFFGCGSIVLNKRYDNHREPLYRYCVRSVRELQTTIVPFFERFPLRTHKRHDFLIFREVIALMREKKHLEREGWVTIIHLAERMNRKKVRSIESSETTCRTLRQAQGKP